jgi:LuxR family maltose regulon positive regulatory protein
MIFIRPARGYSMSSDDTRLRIHILVLETLFHDVQGRTDAALDSLTEAVGLAQADDRIQPFVEFGPRLADLLKELPAKNANADFVRRILDTLGGEEYGEIPRVSSRQRPIQPASLQPAVDLLTGREQDILGLLADRLSTREIADELQISTETVKTHLKRIYRKFGVHSRRQAVSRAADLGFLPRQ